MRVVRACVRRRRLLLDARDVLQDERTRGRMCSRRGLPRPAGFTFHRTVEVTRPATTMVAAARSCCLRCWWLDVFEEVVLEECARCRFLLLLLLLFSFLCGCLLLAHCVSGSS